MGRIATVATRSLLLLVALGSFALALATERRAEPRTESAPRPLAAPENTPPPRAAAPATDLLGVVLARSAADLAPRTAGKLVAVHVRLGDVVTRGQPLAVVDAPTLPFDLRVAEARLRETQAQESHAAADLVLAEERLRQREALAADALARRDDLAAARAQRGIAASQLDAARAQRSERRAELGRLRRDSADTVLHAPFDGIVAARYVDPGASVSPLAPIVRLISAADTFVRFALAEEHAAVLAVGDAVRVRVGEDARAHRGTIEKIAPEVDAAARLVFVEARLERDDAGAPPRPGALARVSIAPKERP